MARLFTTSHTSRPHPRRHFNGNITKWDVSAVTDMSSMFFQATYFNRNLSSWDVSAVTNMQQMFYVAKSFNQKLSKWDVSAVIYMQFMFSKAQSFNQDLSAWDVSAVIDMGYMFYRAQSFNQNLSAWDVSAVTDMHSMFRGACSFKQILCGVSWVDSKAKKGKILDGSHGSISTTVCTATPETTTSPPSTTAVSAFTAPTHKLARHCLQTQKCSWTLLPPDCDLSTCGLARGHGKAGGVICECDSCEPNSKPAGEQCPATPACGSSSDSRVLLSVSSKPVYLYFGACHYNIYKFPTFDFLACTQRHGTSSWEHECQKTIEAPIRSSM